MLYISAQPAEKYFLWQIEILLQNFEDIGIKAENVHVVLSYNKRNGIPIEFQLFAKSNTQANFFFYPDNRINSKYVSSIRPHILAQHFKENPYLEKKTICYHDSDILFREKIDEINLSKTDFWYFSDTRAYISSDYLRLFGDIFFESLCDIVGIDPQIVINNKNHSGGAQHIMKCVNADFWIDVEKYSEIIFSYINNFNINNNQKKKAQSWCADMWALLWTTWKLGKEVRLHKDLDFSWPKEHISNYYEKKIFHNAGVFLHEKNNYFCKLLYKKSTPYYLDFSKFPKDRCAKIYIDQIERLSERQKRIAVNDCTIILYTDNTSNKSQHKKIFENIDYIYKHLKIEVHVLEKSDWPRLNKDLICHKSKYFFLGNKNIDDHIIKKVKTKNFIFIDASILVPYENIIETSDYLLLNENNLIFPMNEIQDLPNKQYEIFQDTLQEGLEVTDSLLKNQAIDFSECFSMSKKSYIRSGGSNLKWYYFLEQGFNLERATRCRLLNITITTINKSAFKLYHKDYTDRDKIKNSEEKYAQLILEDKDYVIRKLKQNEYYFKKGVKNIKKSDIINLGICKITKNIDSENIEGLMSNSENFFIHDVHIDYEQSILDTFINAIRKCKEEKFSHALFISNDIKIEEIKEFNYISSSILKMNMLGLHILTLITEGGFVNEGKIDDNIILSECFPFTSAFIVHKSFFNKIITNDISDINKIINKDIRDVDKIKNFINHINGISGMLVPFLGRIIINKSKEAENDLHLTDKLNYISKIESELVWKIKNH